MTRKVRLTGAASLAQVPHGRASLAKGTASIKAGYSHGRQQVGGCWGRLRQPHVVAGAGGPGTQQQRQQGGYAGCAHCCVFAP